MPTSTVYPLLRPELRAAIDRGDQALARAIQARSQVLSAGTVIVPQDAPHDFVHVLLTGWAVRSRILVDGTRQLISLLLPNDLFGVKTLVMHTQPDAVIALTSATIGSIDCKTARELAARDPNVALRLMFQLGEDERRLHNWTVALSRPAVERIALLLLDLRGRFERLGFLQGDSFHLPLTQQDAGDRLGLSVVHINRVLRELRERRVVTWQKGIVTVHDLPQLKAIALPLLDVFDREAEGFGPPM
jgi:CRP-like cAMP-binding protein